MQERAGKEEAFRATATIGRKTQPPLIQQRVLSRPRLGQLIRSLLERSRVLVVAATAGSGKTTAVAEALAETGTEPAWLIVDAPDSAPGRMLAYLESALARRVSDAANRATAALSAGFSHREAAGLLADALGDEPLVLVLDDLERLPDGSESWEVISAFLRHAPDTVRTIMISRRSLPSRCELPPPPDVAWLDERELAFTSAEAAAALCRNGREDFDAEHVVEVTGGWVMGVLFEAWHSADHIPGAGGEVDPLFSYLGSHILDQLEPELRDFLVRTSILDEVDPRRAAALGLDQAAARMASLRMAHLPVAWEESGEPKMRCHPRFREYLLALLERRDDAELAALRRAHGQLLASEGHLEDATEELLRAGAAEEAADLAERAILAVVERLDLDQARRWLTAFAEPGARPPTNLAIAELMICWGEEDYRGTERVADDLAHRGELEPVARRSGHAAALVSWCYYMRGRPGDAAAVLAAGSGPEVEAVGYLIADSVERPRRPQLSGGPFDLFILFADYFAGRLGEIEMPPGSRWADSVVTAWRIAVLRATGRTARALTMYEEAMAASVRPLGMLTFVGPEIYVDAGDAARAREVIEAAKDRYHGIGADGWAASITLTEARMELRLHRDAAAARSALDAIDAGTYVDGWLFRAACDLWYGFAELLEGADTAALERLRRTVGLMRASCGHIELPSAAVYLSEAEWRAGNEEAADAAAELALEAAARQGSNHLLLQALGDFPAVVSRQIDAEPRTDSAWHRLGRSLLAQGVTVAGYGEHTVLLREFGEASIVIDGEETRPPLSKCLELLAYLASRRTRSASREELLEVLFDGRDDDSVRAYLRQAVHRLRTLLPEEALLSDRASVRLGERATISSESSLLVAGLAETARLRGEARMRAIIEALAPSRAGEYLPRLDAAWVYERRSEVEALCLEAQQEAAELAFEGGDYRLARELSGRTLEADPFRETAWRLRIRIAILLGDADAALEAYRRCEAAFAELGLSPAPETRELLDAGAPR